MRRRFRIFSFLRWNRRTIFRIQFKKEFLGKRIKFINLKRGCFLLVRHGPNQSLGTEITP